MINEKQFRIDRHGLILQMVLSFMSLALVTAVAVGLPAILFTRQQIESLAWAQLNLGQRTAQAFYEDQQRILIDLALLTSQRPTLPQLLTQEQSEPLAGYLKTIQEEAELDLLIICSPGKNSIPHMDTEISINMCRLPNPTGLHIVSSEVPSAQIWMLAAHTVGEETVDLGKVIVGTAVDDAFIRQMRSQTGLEHTLLVNERPSASSLPGGVDAWQTAVRQSVYTTIAKNITAPATLSLNGHPYYTSRLPLAAPGLVDEAALDVAGIAATERRLTWTLTGSIFFVALAGSALGVLMARRIGRPLSQLTRAATGMQQGDLHSSISIPPQVSEATQVAQALENARIKLQRTLSDLRQAQAWTNHLLETITEGIVVLDENGRITFFSPGAEQITGWSQNEVLGRSCDMLFRLADTNDSFSQHIPLPGHQNKLLLELEVDRQITLAITSAQLSPPGTNETSLALVLRDVSEAELVHSLMSGFLANITHEFRTPLSALAASTELLLDQLPDLNQSEMQELLNNLYLGIVSLQTLIDNLLESASLEAGRFRVYQRPADLGQIIAEATHMMQPLQDKYGQRLVVQLPTNIPQVQADARRTVQVLVNLLSNAIKYSPDKTEITLSVGLNKGWARVAVADRGPGVPTRHQATLFHRFEHYGTENSKSQHGARLGLSVVKAIVEAHGGRVGVENRPGGGSIFWFTLPIVSEQ
jgi:PAS domain S-box-containing protein